METCWVGGRMCWKIVFDQVWFWIKGGVEISSDSAVKVEEIAEEDEEAVEWDVEKLRCHHQCKKRNGVC